MTPAANERAARLAQLPFERVGEQDKRLFSGIVASVAEIVRQRQLLRMLVGRDLKSRYKDSSLGFLWSLVRPLTMLLIYYVAIGQFLGAARQTPQFAIFVFTGLTLWALYSETITGGTDSILQNAGLIKKVYLPREIFPLAATGSALVNFGIQLGILIVATIVLGQVPWSADLLYAPAGILVALVFALAFAILLSALNVYLRDVRYLVEVALLVLFWASPIVYPWAFVAQTARDSGMDWIAWVYLLNPVTIAILAFQRGLWIAGSQEAVIGGTTVAPQPWPPDLDLRLIVAFIVGLVFLVVAQRVFSRLQGNFAQEI
jgi:ABC-2 type transport system permease protein